MLDAFSSGLGLRSILVQQIQEINATLEVSSIKKTLRGHVQMI